MIHRSCTTLEEADLKRKLNSNLPSNITTLCQLECSQCKEFTCIELSLRDLSVIPSDGFGFDNGNDNFMVHKLPFLDLKHHNQHLHNCPHEKT